MSTLFRGVSKHDDDKYSGKIIPKGTSNEVTMKYGDPGLRHDGKFTYGPSITNTARSHQVESGMHNGSGISTTRDKSIAEYFATSGGIEDGFVYVIDEDELEKHNISKHEFEDSENPHEHEVTLITDGGTELPESVIIEKYEVNIT